MKKERVLVAMSGGVDSSVSALILKKSGYDVVGVSLKLLSDKKDDRSCCSLSSVEDARKVASILGIPFYVLDAKDIFKKTVIKNFIEEYINGRTPNPCIKCNKFIKFDYLYNIAKELNCKYLATGHYARIKKQNEHFYLIRAKDKNKDQSYFLYILRQEQLKNLLFPVGDLLKDEVRSIAKKFNLPIHNKKESSDICFIPKKKYAEFIIEKAGYKPQEGDILDKDKKVIGKHKGIIYYTYGQRKKIGISSSSPLYVISIDKENNTISVGRKDDLLREKVIAKDVNFIVDIEKFSNITCKVRYRSEETLCKIDKLNSVISITLLKPLWGVTPGQSIVFYSEDIVLGGGIIDG